MKRLLAVLAIAMLLPGCMGTKDYYGAQKAYYDAQRDAYLAQAQAHASRPPLAQMTAPDGTTFVVNLPGELAAPAIRTPENPVVAGLKTVLHSTPASILVGGWAVKEIVKASTGSITASGGSTVTSTSNSHNPLDVRNADGNITQDNNSLNNSHNAVSEPTVVEQPAPVIVPSPDPIIIPAPDPIIIPQPEPIIIGGE